jgi:hypothetical protein
MINQSIAEADPELWIRWVAPGCILENSDRLLALAVACECFGHA